MALIKCPECNTEVSDRADVCVNCGCPINKQTDAEASSPARYSPISGEVELEEFAVTPPFWKKQKASVIVAAVFLLIAAITNPGERKHQNAAVVAFSRQFQNDDDIKNIAGLLGSGFVDATVGTLAALFIERQNYIFFSLTRNKPRDEIIGIGAFGNVWLFTDDVQTGMAQGAIPVQQDSEEETPGVGGGSSTFTDIRDGKTYRTVVIGGKAWMAENLNYQMDGSLCSGGDNSNCEKYGRLYDWYMAMNVCPPGSHLPSRQEWGGLITAAGGGDVAGKKLKAASGWYDNGNGTDTYGFSALPGGGCCSGSIGGEGLYGYWWTATEAEYGGIVWSIPYSGGVEEVDYFGALMDFSVRCVIN